MELEGKRRRSLRGNVDRNIDNADDIAAYQVVPYVGTWIEIPPLERNIVIV